MHNSKSSTEANVFSYPGSYGDTGLYGPPNNNSPDSTDTIGISHVTFCVGSPETTTSEETTTTEESTTTEDIRLRKRLRLLRRLLQQQALQQQQQLQLRL